MTNFGDAAKGNMKEHKSLNWPQNPDHPYKILVIRGSGSEKINSLFNLINCQPDIDIFVYALKHLNDSKAFVEYSNDMDDIYKNIEEQ